VTDKGKVYLVGAGPGDPDLLTVKAMRLIQEADVIIYDRLVSSEIMQTVPRHVARIYVGKATCKHTLKQEEINRLLVDQAVGGRGVVRLKGGDPFIFGRGSEEALALAKAHVPFEVIPGITAAQACAAYAGIPLTHRGLARGVQFITGHRKNNEELQIDKATLGDSGQTLVVYMGLANIARIVDDIIQAGRTVDTPAAIIERGTTARQRTIITTLEWLAHAAQSHAVESPAMLVIGPVVGLAQDLDWFMPVVDEAELRYA
jgi:uroporphyrin-III C-methyltransferase/precorrin-2 dehydrogenase/sirohydrochlorin ferrochelatase/uroporphyrin-III C-methyltransferase